MTRARRAGLCAAVALAAAGWVALAARAEPPAHEDVRSLGTIDAQGLPVAGAEVVEAVVFADGTIVVDDDSSPLATTSPDGRVAALPPPPVPGARLAVRAPGASTVLLPAGRGAVLAVLRASAPVEGRLTVHDPALRGSIAVYALPLEGATDLVHRAHPGPDGAFVFRHLPPGRYRLRTRRASGAWRDVGEVTAPARVDTIEFVRGADVLGTVVSAPAGKPVADLAVSLRRLGEVGGTARPAARRDEDRRLFPVEARTDARGGFAFLDVPAGVYEGYVSDPLLVFDGDPPRIEVSGTAPQRAPAWWVRFRGAIVGRVVDGEGRPLADARIRLAPPPDVRAPVGGFARVADASTGADGLFHVDGVAPGDAYRLVVAAAGRSPEVVFGLDVVSGRVTDAGVVRLWPGWGLDVTVVDAAGNAVAGAEVVSVPQSRPGADPVTDAVAAGLLVEAATDGGGLAALRDLPSGAATIRVRHDGFLEATSSVREGRPGRVDRERVVLPEAAKIVGRLVFAEGKPPPPVRVRVTVRRTGEVRVATPDADGSFAVPGLPPSPADVEAVLSTGREALVLGRVEDVLPGTGEAISLVCAPMVRLSGRVEGLSRSGPPAAVRLEAPHYDARRDDFPWGVVAELRLSPDASPADFSFAAVPPGPYSLRALQGGHDSGAYPVLVESVDVAAPTLVLAAGSTLSGTVLDARRLAFATGARVTLVRLEADGPTPADAAERPATIVGDGGQFSFADVPAGLWRVEATETDVASATTEVRAYEGGQVLVPTLVLTRGGRVEGSVRDDRGRGIAGVAVRSARLPDLDEGPRATTDEDGKFRLGPLAGARWRLTTQSLAEAGGGLEADVEVVDGETTEVDLGSDGRASLEGTVRRRGRPVPGIDVEAVLLDGAGCDSLLHRTVADGNGGFRWTGLPAGRYVLRLVDGQVSSVDPILLREGDRTIRDVELGEGQVRGSVVDIGRVGLRGVEVRVLPARGSRTGVAGRTSTGADGSFRLDGLPVGVYRLAVTPPSRATQVVEGVVADIPPAGAPVDVTIGLGAELDLVVRDDRGRPVGAAQVWVDSRAGETVHSRPFSTAPTGLVRAEGLPEGEARVRVHARGYGRPRALVVTLRDGARTDAEVALPPAGALRVTVTAGRDPVPRARISLLRLPEGEPVVLDRALDRSDPRDTRGLTARTGIVRIDDLEEGVYRVVVVGGGEFEEARRDVRVRAGDPTDVAVGLPLKPR